MKSAFKMFLNEISQYPLLSASEERELARRFKEDGDEYAREQLINCNLRLVVSISKNYNNSHMELMDLISEGTLGLMQAVEKYNPDLGYRFSTCATPWIKQAITKAIIDKGRSIRTPAHIYQELAKYRKAITELATEEHPEPTVAQIAKYMGVSEERVGELENLRYDTVSLSTPIGDDGEETLEDMQADNHSETPEEYTERLAHINKIQSVLKTLKPRTERIVKLRFGLGVDGDESECFEEHTLEEIGEIVGLTRERVRQILKEALAEIKLNWKNNL